MQSDIGKSQLEFFRSSECFGYNRATFMAITIGQHTEALEVAHEKGIVHRDLKPALCRERRAQCTGLVQRLLDS